MLEGICLGLLTVGSPGFVFAQPVDAAKSKKAVTVQEDAPTGSEQIISIIEQLDSVRDYDRLYWILNAINHRKDDGERTSLLDSLDMRVRQILSDKSEEPIPTETRPVETVREKSSARQTAVVPDAVEKKKSEERLIDPVTRKELQTTPAEYSMVRSNIEHMQLPQDMQSRLKVLQDMAAQINALEYPNQRIELFDLMQKRSAEQL